MTISDCNVTLSIPVLYQPVPELQSTNACSRGMNQTFFPDDTPPLTPFNTNSPDGRFDADMVTAADTVFGMAMKTARTWQIIAIIAIACVLFSGFIVLYAVNLPKTIPVIVTVDSTGNATYVGKVDDSYWRNTQANIPENHKTYQIKKFIYNLFTWVIDSNAQNAYIRECEYLCQGNASEQLHNHILSNNPFDNIGRVTKTVEQQEPLRQTENSYVVFFTVSTYQNGYLYRTNKYSALFTIDFFDVTDSTKDLNPLGVYITSFDIKEVTND